MKWRGGHFSSGRREAPLLAEARPVFRQQLCTLALEGSSVRGGQPRSSGRVQLLGEAFETFQIIGIQRVFFWAWKSWEKNNMEEFIKLSTTCMYAWTHIHQHTSRGFTCNFKFYLMSWCTSIIGIHCKKIKKSQNLYLFFINGVAEEYKQKSMHLHNGSHYL